MFEIVELIHISKIFSFSLMNLQKDIHRSMNQEENFKQQEQM
jgi:hypothetical protein